MSEPDELYTLRAQYWLGHYALALDEGRSSIRRPMPPHLKSEREEMMLRAQLGLGQYHRVVAEGTGHDKPPALQALALHASYLMHNTNGDDGGGSAKKSEVIDKLKLLLASTPDAMSNTSLQLTACHIFLLADNNQLREALSCVHHGLTMEHLSMCVQIYIKIDRLDLARDAWNLMKQADEDSILVQLAGVQLALATGSSRSEDALHILSGLAEQYGPSLMLLNCMAVANIVGGNYEAAEGNLKEAIADFGGENDADTLVNMVVCSQYLGRKGDEMNKYLAALKVKCPTHPFVQGLVQVEGAFEREACKYLIA
jgi:coatomer protein complex subunit epsilon